MKPSTKTKLSVTIPVALVIIGIGLFGMSSTFEDRSIAALLRGGGLGLCSTFTALAIFNAFRIPRKFFRE